jgi:hypothetical protein
MDRVDVAEWLLCQVTDPIRAAELVGDVLEADSTAGRLRYWFTIGELFFAFSWRRVLCIWFSTLSGILLGLLSLLISNFRPLGDQHILRETTVGHILVYACGVSTLLWIVATYSLIRFGWRDPLPRIAATTSMLWSGSICFLWYPSSEIALLLVWTAFLIFCMRTEKRRKSLAILLLAIVAAGVTGIVVSPPVRNLDNVFTNGGLLATLLLAPIVGNGVAALLHRRLIRTLVQRPLDNSS